MKTFFIKNSIVGSSLLSVLLLFGTSYLSKVTDLMSETYSQKEFKDLLRDTGGKKIYSLKKVVLDAGHGGKDPGCHGESTLEKDIALDVVLQFGATIKMHYPEIEVVYTRNKDEFIPLHERAQIANASGADLFISIHCNAVGKSSIEGTETYVLGLHRAEDNLAVAKRENAAIYLEEDYKENYDGFDPNSNEGHIMMSLVQNAHLDQSIAFASKIEDSFGNQTKRESRGVKQAGFLVLRNTVMPGVLIEMGFLTNKDDEVYLRSGKGQSQMVKALFSAFKQYKEEVEIYDEEEKIVEELPSEELIASKDEKFIAPIRTKTTKPIYSHKEITTQTAHTGNPDKKKLIYVVQVAASPKKMDVSYGKWRALTDLMIRWENNMYKYQVGDIYTYEKATQTKKELQKKGFQQSFIVAYHDDKKVSITEAQKLE